ncbi:hypothetical protein LFL97_28300 [Burkholderia sp. JSH-S8]|nr:hypothetical protein LFL97_28300 [Burkholderia sp. JSH-S8]
MRKNDAQFLEQTGRKCRKSVAAGRTGEGAPRMRKKTGAAECG